MQWRQTSATRGCALEREHRSTSSSRYSTRCPHIEEASSSPPRGEAGEPFTANEHLSMAIAIRRAVSATPLRGSSVTSRSCSTIPTNDPRAREHLRGGGACRDGSAAATLEAHRNQHHGCPGQVSADERSGVKNLPPSRWKALGDSGSRAASSSASWQPLLWGEE